nr:helix-turn-helix transcriptional regulator [uncultured Carboxylicivirga sp.]
MNQDIINKYLNPVKNTEQPFLLVSELQQLCSAARDANNTEHSHDFYTIYLLKEGDVNYSTAHLSEKIPTPGLLFIGPGILHRMEIAPTSMGSTVIFNNAFINLEQSTFFKDLPFFSDDQIYSLLPLTSKSADEYENLILMMKNEYNGELNGNGLLLKNFLNVLLLKAQHQLHESPLHSGASIPSSHHSTLLQFKKLLGEQFTQTRQVADYAQQLNIQPECLNEVTKDLAGITASELIRNKILNETRKLLFTTNLSFKEIALQLGFEDTAYFSRYFKKHTGQTMKEFRQHIQNLSK